MGRLEHRLTPAFLEHFGQKMLLVLDNASDNDDYGFDPEVKDPESNTKL